MRIIVLTIVSMFLAICALAYQLHNRDKEIKALNQCITELKPRADKADSLDAELFHTSIELNRFQIAFEIFARRHPVYAEIYASIISDETE